MTKAKTAGRKPGPKPTAKAKPAAAAKVAPAEQAVDPVVEPAADPALEAAQDSQIAGDQGSDGNLADAGDPPAAPAETPPPPPPPPPEPKLKKAKPGDPKVAPLGCCYVAHPESIGCSYRGIEIEADADGHCLVPQAALEDLSSHGFGLVS